MLVYFFDNPYSEVYLRELARKTHASPSTLSRILSSLVGEGLIGRRDEKNGSFFRASMNSEFKALKVAYTISKITAAQIIELIGQKSKGLSSVLLYGSAARGEDDSNSDYDLLVIAAECTAAPHQISELLGRESNLQVYSIAKWKQTSKLNRAFYLEVISNSIALKGNKPVID